jgi:hypothetical protein
MRLGRTHRAVQNELSASGELLDHKEPALDNAKIVRTERLIPVITNGPFAGDKEILGGYYLVDCVSLERATEISSQFLEAEFAPIEVAPTQRRHLLGHRRANGLAQRCRRGGRLRET